MAAFLEPYFGNGPHAADNFPILSKYYSNTRLEFCTFECQEAVIDFFVKRPVKILDLIYVSKMKLEIILTVRFPWLPNLFLKVLTGIYD